MNDNCFIYQQQIIDTTVLNYDLLVKRCDTSRPFFNFSFEEIHNLRDESKELNYQGLESIEMQRTGTYGILSKYYDFYNSNEILGFIETNNNLIIPVLNLYNEILNKFNPKKLELELFIESKEWQTLFINLYIDAKFNYLPIQDQLLDFLLVNYPNDCDKLNFSFIPYDF